jgi:hypothetical protein
MHIIYGVEDIQIGSVVCLVLDSDIKGMVTGIQFRDGSFTYLVTLIINNTPSEQFLRPIEIRMKK